MKYIKLKPKLVCVNCGRIYSSRDRINAKWDNEDHIIKTVTIHGVNFDKKLGNLCMKCLKIACYVGFIYHEMEDKVEITECKKEVKGDK